MRTNLNKYFLFLGLVVTENIFQVNITKIIEVLFHWLKSIIHGFSSNYGKIAITMA